jgi:hypothetical protein
MEVALSPLPASFAELQDSEATMLYLPRLRHRAGHSLLKLRKVGFRKVVPEAGVDAALEDARAAAIRDGWRFEPERADTEVAFSVGMLRIWQRVVDDALPYLLIFEDDVLPHPDIERLGPAYWDDTPRDADFVFMGNQMAPQEVVHHANDRVVAIPAWCLHAFVITQQGAREGLARLRADQAADPDGLAILDAEMKRWMAGERVRYACWNGTMLPRVFPRSDEVPGDGEHMPDIAWAGRDTGLFFQNFALGSAIFPNGRPR